MLVLLVLLVLLLMVARAMRWRKGGRRRRCAFAVQFAESTHVAHRQIATLREPTPTSA